MSRGKLAWYVVVDGEAREYQSFDECFIVANDIGTQLILQAMRLQLLKYDVKREEYKAMYYCPCERECGTTASVTIHYMTKPEGRN